MYISTHRDPNQQWLLERSKGFVKSNDLSSLIPISHSELLKLNRVRASVWVNWKISHTGPAPATLWNIKDITHRPGFMSEISKISRTGPAPPTSLKYISQTDQCYTQPWQPITFVNERSISAFPKLFFPWPGYFYFSPSWPTKIVSPILAYNI